MVTFSEENSVKERILQNIVATLEGITIANGFGVDVGTVLRYRIAGYDTVDYPAIMVIGARENKTRLKASPAKTQDNMTVTIEIHATDDALQDAETYHDLIMRDVEAALMEDVTRGNLARDTDVDSTVFTVVASQDPYALSVVQVTVRFQHDTLDPTKAR